ncbi:hypothetical protein [Spiroplasma endosymbiont of Seladonia tumulorum]|uniref:hypothetical protein n=1 Tax=Spiroplasma endosymbiont of Seladonia tumulorum TaxID=3066321 RepID=UPI0030D10A93
MKIINNLNKPFFNPTDDDSDDEKTFEVSEQNKKIKSNNQDITQNNEPLKNDFLNNLSKDFKDITFVEKNDSKRVLDNRLIVPLPKIEKSKRWRELADNRLSFFKIIKYSPKE